MSFSLMEAMDGPASMWGAKTPPAELVLPPRLHLKLPQAPAHQSVVTRELAEHNSFRIGNELHSGSFE